MLLIGAIGSAWGDDYALYSGEITEGDYLIVYNGAAMKAYINNSRLQYTEVKITNNVISNPAADLIWTISKDNVETQYYKLYNSSIEKYAASTGAANKAQLTTTIDKKIRWTITGNSTYEFINQQNLANSVNANLRRNGTYGFACYSTSTGGALSLYKKVGTITEIPTTTTINTTGITNTDVYTSTAAGSLSAIVSAEGNTISGATVTWSSNNTDVATINANGVITLVAAGTVTFTANYAGVSEQYEASSATYEMTVTNSAPIQAESDWVETSLSELTTSDVFVIVGTNSTGNYALANNNGTSAAPTAVSVTISNSYLTSTVGDNIKWTIGGNATDGYTFYPNGSTATWLYCTNTNNGVRVGTNDNKTFIVSENGYLKHVATSRYIGIYDSQDWRCYTPAGGNIGNQSFKFYKYVGSPEPAINASDVNIAYDATNGSITYTVENSVIGGTLTAATEDEWLTIETIGTTVPFTCEANTNAASRTATVTLTYTYNTNQTKTKEVIITQAGNPNFVNNISDIVAENTSYAIRGTIVAKSARGLVFGDGTGYVYYYNQSYDKSAFNVGDVKKISGTIGSYNHVYQFTNSATIETAESSNYNNTPTVQILDASAFASYNEGLHLSDYVQFEGKLIKSNNYYNIQVDGLSTDASISYPTTEQAEELDGLNDKTVRVKGYFAGVSGGHFGVVLESVEEVAVQHEEYTLTVGNLSHVNTFVFDANDDSQLLLEGEGSVQILDGTEVLISVDVESDYQIESLIVDGEDVTSQVDETGAYTFTMPDHAVTISATATQGSITPVSDGKYVKVTSANDLTSGQYLIVYEDGSVAFNGGLETLDAVGNTIEVELANNEIAATTQTAAAEFTIDVTEGTIKSASGLYIGQTSDANGLASSTTTAFTNTLSIDADGNAVIQSSGNAYMRYNATSGQDRFRYFKSSTYTSQKAIQLYKKVEESPAITVTIGSVGYTTFVAPADVSFPEGVEAFIVTAISTSSIHMEPVTAVPSGTPVVVKASEGTHELSVATETDDVTDNLLLASDGNVTGNGTIYALGNKSAGVGFYPVKSGANVPEGKAYLVVGNENIKEFFSFDFGGLVTEINNVSTDADANVEIYNLAGQRVQKVQKGFYIVGGKKVLVK